VVVEVYDKGQNGAPDKLVNTFNLNYPTAMVDAGITSSRYLVVKETD